MCALSNLTRRKLYELVWSRPLKQIAKDYGFNAIRLAKACDDYEIARPPPGYWQKLEYGKSVARPPLSVSTFGSDDVANLGIRGSVEK